MSIKSYEKFCDFCFVAVKDTALRWDTYSILHSAFNLLTR